MSAVQAALVAEDPYTCVWVCLQLAVTRDNAAALVFHLEPAFSDLLNRSRGAHLTTTQVTDLQLLLGVCRRRCESLLPPHCAIEDIRAGFHSARQLIDMWVLSPSVRSSHTIEQDPYAEILRFHGVLRSLRRSGTLSTVPVLDPFADCEIIPFPKPHKGCVR